MSIGKSHDFSQNLVARFVANPILALFPRITTAFR